MSRPDTKSSRMLRQLAARVLTGSALWLGQVTSARDGEPSPVANASNTATGTRRALVICGLPGDQEHRKLFAATLEKLHKSLTGRYRFAGSEILVRFGTESQAGDGPALASSRGLSSREGIARDVDEMRKRLGPEDTLWVIVMGHGHYDGRHSHLNLPGPDLDERGFAKLFEGMKAREQVFLITTAASGFFLKPLATTGRIVVTATEPDLEVNETLFPHALADVLAAPPDGTDRNKDGKISILELYLAVAADVMKRYAAVENLPTEHARLDDNGDGRGSEIQERYLPAELGGRAGAGPEPTIGPKDDGAVASSIRIDPPTVLKP